MANVGGVNGILGGSAGQTTADPVIQKVQAYYEEEGIRALTDDTDAFVGFYNLIHYQDNLPSPADYTVLDSFSVNDPSLQLTAEENDQNQLTTLAAYYLLAPTNPSQGALDFFGGGKWVQSWSPPPAVFNHWSPAATYDVGAPVSALPQTPEVLVPNGSDPENSNYKFNVYERYYTGPSGQNILVLYKPVSEYNNQPGTTDTQTATTVTPTGGYSWYVLQADGTLSSTAVTSISLQNGEGAILVQAGTLAPAIAGATRIAAPVLTSPAAATAATPSAFGAPSVSQSSPGPTAATQLAAERFEQLLPGWFVLNAAGAGQVPLGPSVNPSDLPAVLDRIFSLWTVAKSDLDRVFYLWTMAKKGTAFSWSNEPAT